MCCYNKYRNECCQKSQRSSCDNYNRDNFSYEYKDNYQSRETYDRKCCYIKAEFSCIPSYYTDECQDIRNNCNSDRRTCQEEKRCYRRCCPLFSHWCW